MMSNRSKRRAGFTLIELMITVAILGILATIAIPTLIRFQLRAKMSEVKANIAALAVSQEAYFSEWGAYVTAAPAVPAAVGSTQVDWSLAPGDPHGFNTLGFKPEGKVYYQYAITASGAPAYTIEARSDLDGDTTYNTWGYLKPGPGVVPTGIAGPFGVCPTTGVLSPNSGLFNMFREIGACDTASGTTEF